MSIPVFRSAGTWAFTANNVANGALSPGAPTGKAVGDLLILVCETSSNTATVSTPSGWNLPTGFPVRSGTSVGGTIYVFTRIADGTASDTPSPSWASLTTGTTGTAAGAGILAYRLGSTTLDGTVQSSDLAAQTTTSVIPAFTTATNNSLVIGIAVKMLESSAQTSTVATFTERADNSTTSGTGHVVEVSDKIQTVAGSSGTATVTWSATTSARALTASLGLQALVISPTDTGLTITDSISKKTYPAITDTGLTVTSSIGRSFPRTIVDIGLASFGYAPILDNFNRADENPLSGGGNWIKAATAGGALQIVSNQVQGQSSTAGYYYWSPNSFTNCEAYITILTITSNIVLARITPGSGTLPQSAYGVRLLSNTTGDIRRYDAGVGSTIGVLNIPFTIVANDKIGIRCNGNKIEAWIYHGGVWNLVGSVTDNTYASGFLGLGSVNTTANLDDFGGISDFGFNDSIVAVSGGGGTTFNRTASDNAFTQSPILDDFNRADGGLGSNWPGLLWTGYHAPQIVSNQVAGSTTFPSAYWHTQLTTPCEVWMQDISSSDFYLALYDTVPWTSGVNGNGYVINIVPGSYLHILRSDTGANTQIATTDPPTLPCYVKLRVYGGVITALTSTDGVNWSVAVSVTDTTYTGPFYAGFGTNDSGGEVLDNFGGGNFGISDSVVSVKTEIRTITDTGLTNTDTTASSRNRQLADTGLTVTSTTVTKVTRAKTDTGLTVTDSIVPVKTRTLTDWGILAGFPSTGVLDTFTDASAPRDLSVYDSTNWSGALFGLGGEFKTNADGTTHVPALNFVADYWKSATWKNTEAFATVTAAPAGTSLEVWARLINPSTSGISFYTINLDLPSGTAIIGKEVNNSFTTLATISVTIAAGDQFGLRILNNQIFAYHKGVLIWQGVDNSITSTGFIAIYSDGSVGALDNVGGGTYISGITDSVGKSARHNITDTGLTNTDTLVHQVIHADSDTGLTISDTLRKSAVKNLTDTGATITDTLASRRNRALTDTGLTITDSIARSQGRVLYDNALNATTNGPVGPHGTPILDNFNRADSGTLGANWTPMLTGYGYPDFQIISNTAQPAGGGPPTRYSADVWNPTTFTDCEVFVTAASGGSGGVILVRFPTGAPITGYGMQGNAGHLYLSRFDNNGAGYTILWETNSFGLTPGGGDRWGLVIRGSLFEMWIDQGNTGTWVLAGSYVDTEYTNSGYIGLYSNDVTNALMDNFGGGSFVAITDSISSSKAKGVSISDIGLGSIPSSPVFPTTSILDACNRSETPLSHGGDWSGWAGPQLRDITTSATAASGSGSFASAYWNPAQFANSESYATVVGASGTRIYMYLRASADASINYLAFFDVGTTTGEIHNSAGFIAAIATPTTIVAGDVIGFSAVGNTLTAWQNGASVGSVADSTITSGYLAMAVLTTGTNGDGFKDFGGGYYGLKDSLNRVARHNISDTGLTVTDTISLAKFRSDSDTGLTISDSLQKSASKNLTDTGLTETDTAASRRTRVLTDTGLTNTDSIARTSSHSISLTDTGLTNTSTTVTNRTRVFATTGLTNSDSISETSVHNRTITDTGLTESDTLVHAAIRSDSDTGLNLSDSIARTASHNISLTDTGLSETDSTVRLVTHALTDTGLTESDSIARVNITNRSITDTGATITDSSVSNRTRVFSDTGLTNSDSIARTASHNISTTDTGLTESDSLVHQVVRSDADTGLTISDSIARTATHPRTITDTGATITDSTIRLVAHFDSDTGLTNTDSIARSSSHNISLTDTGATISDSLVTLRLRNLADTGLTNTDSIARTSTHPRSITDTGLTETDTLVHQVVRSDSDTGLNISDSIVRTASHNISLSDTGATITDSTVRLVSHFDTDTGLTNTDSIARTSSHSISITDTGLTETDTAASRRTRVLTDTGLTNTDSIARSASHNISVSDTGLTESDSLVHLAIRSDSDTGLSINDSTRKSVSKFISDTGLTLTDVISTGGYIAIIDTGLSIADSITPTASHFRTATDTGLTLSDTLVTNRNRAISDTGLTNTDSIARTAVHNITATDTGLTLTDTLVHLVTRLDSDTGLSINDSTSRTASHFRSATDTGLTESDNITLAGGLSITDTGLTLSDSLRKSASKTLSDTGLTETDAAASSRTRTLTDTGLTNTDSISRTASHSIALSDTGLTLSDTLVHSVSRSDADTGLTISDAIQKSARHNVTDTGLTNTDSISTSAAGTIHISDTGLTLSDSIARTATHNRSASDTGLTLSDSIASAVIKPRSLTDTGLTNTDSTSRTATHSRSITDSVTLSDALQHHVYKSDADTGLTISDTLVRGGTAFLSDTGLTVSDSITKFASKSISTTGLTLSDSVTNLPIFYRTISDTGLTESDSIAFVKTSQTIPVSDVGLTVSDFIQKAEHLFIADAGMNMTDVLTFVPQVIRGFYKVAIGRDGYYRSYVTRWR